LQRTGQGYPKLKEKKKTTSNSVYDNIYNTIKKFAFMATTMIINLLCQLPEKEKKNKGYYQLLKTEKVPLMVFRSFQWLTFIIIYLSSMDISSSAMF
jgi:hypothetical protein